MEVCVNVNGIGFEELEEWLGTSFPYNFEICRSWDFGYSLFTATWSPGIDTPVLVLDIPKHKCWELNGGCPGRLEYSTRDRVISSQVSLCLFEGKPVSDPLDAVNTYSAQLETKEDYMWACRLSQQFPTYIELNNVRTEVNTFRDLRAHKNYSEIRDMFWRYGDLQFAVNMFSERPLAYPEEVPAEVISKFEIFLQDWIPYGTKGEEVTLKGKRFIKEPFVRGRMKNSIEELRPYAQWLPVRGRKRRSGGIATLLATRYHDLPAKSPDPKPVMPEHLSAYLLTYERPAFRRYEGNNNTRTFDVIEMRFTLPYYASKDSVREWVQSNSRDIISYTLKYIAWTADWRKYGVPINVLKATRITITNTHQLHLMFEIKGEYKLGQEVSDG